MSNWHSLKGSIQKHQIGVVFHIPIPNVVNAVNVNYRTAISKSEPFTVSIVPALATDFPTEIAPLQSGALYEYQELVEYNANLTDAQKVGFIDARYAVLVTEIQSKLQNQYIYWGKAHDAT